MDQKTLLQKSIIEALLKLASVKGISLENPEVELQRPREETHGDWASNVALKFSKQFGSSPRELATALAEALHNGSGIQSVEVAGPGFLNFRLSNQWTQELVEQITKEGADYGRSNVGEGEKVQIEFVSANPTGPLHVGHGRGAAVGDVLARIMSFAGWDVQKEYYVNDAGLQMSILGRSIQSRYFELIGEPDKAPFPEESYKGAYIYDLAKLAVQEKGTTLKDVPLDESLSYFSTLGASTILEGIKADLADFGVTFDQFYSEKKLYTDNLVPQAVDTLKKGGHIFEQDGAQWFKSTPYGDDKDRVLYRSNGVPTYFASDIAYHKNKFDRGFQRVIDIWGCDHHGYIPRLKAAIEALGKNSNQFNVLLIQFVNLLIDGQPVSMSTRAGTFETLADVVKEVGVDATRYYFLMRRSDSTVDFDMDQAKSSSNDNPVYYTQYAHARCCSLLAKAAERGVALETVAFNWKLCDSPEEKRLLVKLGQFGEEVARAAREMEPHRLVTYLYDLAGEFHGYYNAHHILDLEPSSRDHGLALVKATKQVLANCLGLLGISAPERM